MLEERRNFFSEDDGINFKDVFESCLVLCHLLGVCSSFKNTDLKTDTKQGNPSTMTPNGQLASLRSRNALDFERVERSN